MLLIKLLGRIRLYTTSPLSGQLPHFPASLYHSKMLLFLSGFFDGAAGGKRAGALENGLLRDRLPY
jgi:hypothetical protein